MNSGHHTRHQTILEPRFSNVCCSLARNEDLPKSTEYVGFRQAKSLL